MSVTRLKPARRGRHKGTEIDVKVKPNRLTEIFPGFLLSSFTWILSHYFVQPLFGPNEYYIDEEFHVPQVRHYCLAEFHKWDPKITTLPGLYLLSAVVLVPCMKIYYTICSIIGILDNDFTHDPCSLIALRAINSVGAPACLYYAYYRCQQLLLQNENKRTINATWTHILLALSVATFPIIYAPYAMLYYTDSWATASVFLWYSYHLCDKSNTWIKTIMGVFCVLCRQTNVAWLVFASIIDVCQCAEHCFPSVKESVTTFSYIKACITELFNCCVVKKKKPQRLIDFIQRCWRATCSNLIVIGLFILFVVVFNNGDIVVGDRRAHIPCFHPMQLCYFVVFVLMFSFPWLSFQIFYQQYKISNSVVNYLKITKVFVHKIQSVPKVLLITLLVVTSGLVYFNTIAHPYLLADNRHYTFYIWRLFFSPGKPVFLRYLPVPLYAYGLYYVDTTLTQSSIANKLAFWIVTPLILCPQFLLEPRYFVAPYLMYRLHSLKYNNFKAALFEFISYQCFNFVIMWVFLYRPFISTMDNTGRLDRFAW